MSTKEINITVKLLVDDTENEFADTDIACVLSKLIQFSLDSGLILGDYVHEEILDKLCRFEVVTPNDDQGLEATLARGLASGSVKIGII